MQPTRRQVHTKQNMGTYEHIHNSKILKYLKNQESKSTDYRYMQRYNAYKN